MFHRLPAAVDILEIGPREAADHRLFRALGDLAHGAEIALRGDREPGFDDVHAHVVEHLGDLELLLVGHRRTGRLFAVAERRVENQDAVLVTGHGHVGFFPGLSAVLLVGLREGADMASSERSRRMARSEAAKQKQRGRPGARASAGGGRDMGRDHHGAHYSHGSRDENPILGPQR